MAIKMTPSELRDLASTIKGIRDEIEGQVTNMDKRISSDTAEWDGESKTQYFTDYDALLPTLQETFPQVIEDLASKLTFAADKLEEADQDIAAALKN
mgnify:CR=1 FL=1